MTEDTLPIQVAEVTSLSQLFEATAARVPDSYAVLTAAGALTYRELHLRSIALADRLTALHIRPGAPVALVVGRDLDAAVGIVGILRSGAAYVPMDSSYPQKRIL